MVAAIVLRPPRDPEYVPDRILLGLSGNTLFAAIQRAVSALGRQNRFKNRAGLLPRPKQPLLTPLSALPMSFERSPSTNNGGGGYDACLTTTTMMDVPPPPSDRVAIVKGMITFGGGQHRHPAVVERDIEALASAESEYDAMVREREEVDRISESRRRALDEAEEDVRLATEAEERARKALEDARERAQRSARDVDGMVRKADHDLSKATALLRRRRDAVRRELRRREYDGAATGAGAGAGGSFDIDKADDGTIRLNPDFNRQSSMAAMGFETRTRTTVEALRREELRIEGDYSQRSIDVRPADTAHDVPSSPTDDDDDYNEHNETNRDDGSATRTKDRRSRWATMVPLNPSAKVTVLPVGLRYLAEER
ncbi:hypothetical protein ACHAW5_001123 [Stephanodiscus triporus]|uniref:Uncharacterized protein n=1 Tax=Stephanodiscus triporus TaxID=2934178 RepID=A0ABD3NL89_9STRA